MDPRSAVTYADSGTPVRVDKPSGKSVVMQAKRWHVLEILARAHDWSHVVELGTREGWTARHLLSALPEIRVTSVDLFQDNDPGYLAAERALSKYRGRATLTRQDSAEAASTINGKVDCVFIDADHSVDACTRDIKAWAPMIRKGGWLMGHDWHFPTVRLAVQNCKLDPTIFPDNVWGVRL
jgi:predicted O-methyltransferase YrrM